MFTVQWINSSFAEIFSAAKIKWFYYEHFLPWSSTLILQPICSQTQIIEFIIDNVADDIGPWNDKQSRID